MIMLYFSGTGNSEYIASQFALKTGAKCHSIEEDIDFNSLIRSANTMAFCYPIYGSCVPRIMREFVQKNANLLIGKQIIVFCTQMLFSGDGTRAFTRLIKGLESNVIYAEHFNMPNNISNFWLFPIGDKERVRKLKKTDIKLEQTYKNIQNGIVKRRGWNAFSMLLGKFQNTYWYSIEEKKKGSFIADSGCNRCGLCVRCCPVANLSISPTGITHHGNCILCYRCVNLCPQKAAAVMLHSRPKKQYKGPLQK